MLSIEHDRSLVDACSLVGTLELQQLVFVFSLTVITKYYDPVCINKINGACMFGKCHNPGIFRRFMFHSGSDDRSLCYEKRHSLTLHVGSHKCTVSVVVFQERNQCSSYRYDLLRGYVHVIDRFSWNQVDFTACSSCCHSEICKMSLRVQRFISLSNDLVFFIVSSQILDLICNSAGFFIYNTIRCFNKSVFVHDPVCCQGADQTDVRTFWSLDRTHSSIVRMMYISNLETSSFSGKSSRAQCGKSSLVGQFCQRVVLVHKLRQLRTSEKFFYCSSHRTNIHQSLRSDLRNVLCRHSFLDGTFHSGKSDTYLILQQFTNGTQSSVAQMVDIISITDTIVQIQKIAD